MVKVRLLILLPAVLLRVALGSPPGPLDTRPHLLHVLPASWSLSHLCTLLPTRNFLSMAVSPHCPVPSTLLSRILLPFSPHITCCCLPHSVSSLHQGQGRGLSVPEWQSPLAPSFVTSKTSALCCPGCLSLSVFLPAVFHTLSLPVYSRGTPWPDTGYHPTSYQLHSHVWGLISSSRQLPTSTINYFFLWHLAFSLPK